MNWRMKPEITKYMYTDPELTIEKQRRWYEKINNDPSVRYWIIEYDGIAIGLLNITEIDLVNRRCFWGYYIGDDRFRGKGIAKTLECNLYDYVFYKLGLHKLCMEVLSFNEKVVKLHQKFGSEIEGIFKEHIYKNGQFFDVVRMAVLKRKWDRIRSQYDYDKIDIE
jgi:hypothetical protein